MDFTLNAILGVLSPLPLITVGPTALRDLRRNGYGRNNLALSLIITTPILRLYLYCFTKVKRY